MKKSQEEIISHIATCHKIFNANNENTELLSLEGICNISLNQFQSARILFEMSTQINIEYIPNKKKYYNPWEVLYSWIFSGCYKYAIDIWKILDFYRENDYAALAPLAKYSYIAMELLSLPGVKLSMVGLMT